MGAGPCFGTWVPPPVAPPPRLQDSLVRVCVYWLDESSPCPASTSTLDFTSLFQFPWGQGQGGGGQGQRESGWGGLSGGPWVSGTPPGQSPTLSSAGVKENLCPPCASLCPQGFWARRRGRGAPVDGLRGVLGPGEPGRSGCSLKVRGLRSSEVPSATLPCYPAAPTNHSNVSSHLGHRRAQSTAAHFLPFPPCNIRWHRSASPSGGPSAWEVSNSIYLS